MSLKNKYREVLVGFEKYSFSEEDVSRRSLEFEAALSDLEACKRCQAQKIRNVGKENAPFYVIEDCRSQAGNGLWWGLSHAGCRMYRHPSFALHNCAGPFARLKQIRDARTITYLPEPPERAAGNDAQPGLTMARDALQRWQDSW